MHNKLYWILCGLFLVVHGAIFGAHKVTTSSSSQISGEPWWTGTALYVVPPAQIFGCKDICLSCFGSIVFNFGSNSSAPKQMGRCWSSFPVCSAERRRCQHSSLSSWKQGGKQQLHCARTAFAIQYHSIILQMHRYHWQCHTHRLWHGVTNAAQQGLLVATSSIHLQNLAELSSGPSQYCLERVQCLGHEVYRSQWFIGLFVLRTGQGQQWQLALSRFGMIEADVTWLREERQGGQWL